MSGLEPRYYPAAASANVRFSARVLSCCGPFRKASPLSEFPPVF